MDKISTILIVLSSIVILSGVLDGLYVLIPFAVIAVSLFILNRRPKVITVDKIDKPDKDRFNEEIEEIKNKYEIRKQGKITKSDVEDFLKRIK